MNFKLKNVEESEISVHLSEEGSEINQNKEYTMLIDEN